MVEIEAPNRIRVHRVTVRTFDSLFPDIFNVRTLIMTQSSVISDVVVKALIACESPMEMEWARMLAGNSSWDSWTGGPHPASCVQVYGFDVILDDALETWLLQSVAFVMPLNQLGLVFLLNCRYKF